MDLVRDVLDKKLKDREDCDMGRVSGLVMHVGENTQPRVTHVLIGGAALWMRVHPALGRLSSKLGRMWEIWVARNIIERIPGGGSEEEE
jgi:hypothetical protein